MKIRCNREIRNANVAQAMVHVKSFTRVFFYTPGKYEPELLETQDMQGVLMDILTDGGKISINRNNIVTARTATGKTVAFSK